MMQNMRTTLTLEEDVAREAKKTSQRLKLPFKKVINQALRLGLQKIEEAQTVKPYRTKAKKLGLKPPYQLDNIQELIAQLEGESAP